MDEQQTLNGSYQFNIADNHYFDVATTASLKGSFVSHHSSSLSRQSREKILNIISSNLNKKSLSPQQGSSIISLQDLPSSNNRQIDNFHLRYLQVQQWPELSPEEESSLRIKYKVLKSKYILSQKEKNRLLETLKQIQTIPCQDCPLLRNEVENKKQALKQAIQLSKMLLREVRKIGTGSLNKDFNQ